MLFSASSSSLFFFVINPIATENLSMCVVTLKNSNSSNRNYILYQFAGGRLSHHGVEDLSYAANRALLSAAQSHQVVRLIRECPSMPPAPGATTSSTRIRLYRYEGLYRVSTVEPSEVPITASSTKRAFVKLQPLHHQNPPTTTTTSSSSSSSPSSGSPSSLLPSVVSPPPPLYLWSFRHPPYLWCGNFCSTCGNFLSSTYQHAYFRMCKQPYSLFYHTTLASGSKTLVKETCTDTWLEVLAPNAVLYYDRDFLSRIDSDKLFCTIMNKTKWKYHVSNGGGRKADAAERKLTSQSGVRGSHYTYGNHERLNDDSSGSDAMWSLLEPFVSRLQDRLKDLSIKIPDEGICRLLSTWKPNYALFNLYPTGEHYMSWHHDKSKEREYDRAVASVSLGV